MQRKHKTVLRFFADEEKNPQVDLLFNPQPDPVLQKFMQNHHDPDHDPAEVLRATKAVMATRARSIFEAPEEPFTPLTALLVENIRHYLKNVNPEHKNDDFLRKAYYWLLRRGEEGRKRAEDILGYLEGLTDVETLSLIYPATQITLDGKTEKEKVNLQDSFWLRGICYDSLCQFFQASNEYDLAYKICLYSGKSHRAFINYVDSEVQKQISACVSLQQGGTAAIHFAKVSAAITLAKKTLKERELGVLTPTLR